MKTGSGKNKIGFG